MGTQKTMMSICRQLSASTPGREWKEHPEESLRAQPAIGDMSTEHTVDVKCTYKCTDLGDGQCECSNDGETIRKSSESYILQTSATMSSEEVSDKTKNFLSTSHLVY